MKGTTSNLACEERHAAGRGPDPNANVGLSTDAVLDRRLRQQSFIQADEHLHGHPSGPSLDRFQHRSFVHPQACPISYGPTQPSLSVAGSVGECVTDIATDDTHTHAQACVGDRGMSRNASVREQHTRSHMSHGHSGSSTYKFELLFLWVNISHFAN